MKGGGTEGAGSTQRKRPTKTMKTTSQKSVDGGEWIQLGVRFRGRGKKFLKRSEEVSLIKEQKCSLLCKGLNMKDDKRTFWKLSLCLKM